MANEKWPHGSLSTVILSSLSYMREAILTALLGPAANCGVNFSKECLMNAHFW